MVLLLVFMQLTRDLFAIAKFLLINTLCYFDDDDDNYDDDDNNNNNYYYVKSNLLSKHYHRMKRRYSHSHFAYMYFQYSRLGLQALCCLPLKQQVVALVVSSNKTNASIQRCH